MVMEQCLHSALFICLMLAAVNSEQVKSSKHIMQHKPQIVSKFLEFFSTRPVPAAQLTQFTCRKCDYMSPNLICNFSRSHFFNIDRCSVKSLQ